MLKKTAVPGIATSDLFLGAVVAVYARQLKVVEFGDAFTERAFAVSRQRAFAVVPETHAATLGKTTNAFQSSGFAVADVKMVSGKELSALVADGAIDKLNALVPELEAHLGAGCVVAFASAEEAAAEADFVKAPATARWTARPPCAW